MWQRLRNIWHNSQFRLGVSSTGNMYVEKEAEPAKKPQRLATFTSDYDPIKELKRQPE